ncbi:hypothetical protein BLA29_011497, partial [Euroglyphus maynei]
MTLSVSQNDSIAQILSGLSNPVPIATSTASVNNVSGIQVPTTDPPSYASSMAALAAQRAIVISPSVGHTNGGNSSTYVQSATAIVATTTTSDHHPANKTLCQANNSQNCDLVNTVESICTSQISALQGGTSSSSSSPATAVATVSAANRRIGLILPSSGESAPGPPLPPKPNSSNTHANHVQPPPPPPPPLSHLHSGHLQSLATANN